MLKWQNEGLALAEGALKSRQRSWDEPKSEATAARLLEEADQFSRARLLASASRERADFGYTRCQFPHLERCSTQSHSVLRLPYVLTQTSVSHTCVDAVRGWILKGSTVYHVTTVLDAIRDIQHLSLIHI